jgi:hypothetical protein
MVTIDANAISLILLCQGIVNAEFYDLLNAAHQIQNTCLEKNEGVILSPARLGR